MSEGASPAPGRKGEPSPYGEPSPTTPATRTPAPAASKTRYLCSATLNSHSISGNVKHQAEPKCQASSGTAHGFKGRAERAGPRLAAEAPTSRLEPKDLVW